MKQGRDCMKWVYIALLVSVIIAPFDALYIYIRSEKRKEALKKKSEKQAHTDNKDVSRDKG